MNAHPVKVLLVEDDPDYADALRGFLQPASHFELAHAKRLDEALPLLAKSVFDVAVFALSLPDQQGLAALHEFRAAAPALPMVVLADSDQEALAFQSVREGAQDYLVKGEFDGKMLARVLRYAIERKRSEESLRQSAEFFRLISDNVSDLIAVIDRDGKRLYNSPSYKHSIGNEASLEGTSSFQEIHPEDKERIKKIFQETLATGTGVRSEYRMLLPDGSVRHIESQGNVIKDGAGRTSRVVMVSRDITERKLQMETLEKALIELHQTHEKLKAAQMQAIQSEKLEAVSLFAGSIAHEVKNPLQSIMLGVDFLKTTFEKADEEVRGVLDEMDHAARRADAVIRGMVEFAASGPRDVKDHDLNRTLEHSLEAVAGELAGRSIRLIKELAPDLPAVRLDLKTARHVFMNLLAGAIQSMSGGGTLTVRTRLQRLDADEKWSGKTPGQLKAGETVVVAEVEDDGLGVIESKLADKSERSFPTEMIRKGVLELVVLKKVIELYGGMIRIMNREEGGVKVTLLFKAQPKE